MGEKARAGDGVIAGAGRVDGRPVFCYSQDPSYLGGSLGEAARRVDHPRAAARRPRGRARRRLHRVRRRAHAGGPRRPRRLRPHLPRARRAVGPIPQISVICGASAGGGSYSPALTDFVVMTERASMFLTGPAVVREVMGEDVSAADLGGHKVHERNGVAHFVAKSDEDAAMLVRDLLDHLPASSRERPPRWRSAEPGRLDPSEAVPDGRAPRLRRARRRARPRRRRAHARVGAALGAQPRLRLRPPRGPRGRRHRQPAALPRRRPRRRLRLQGRALRAHLQRVRAPARRARGHARLHARHAPGAGRRDPPRREARARVRRGRGAEDHALCCARRSGARSSP